MTFRSLRTGLIATVLLSGLLGACARVTVFVATDAPDPSIFTPYHSDVGRFTVDIPGTFAETVKTTDNPYLGPIEVHYFIVNPDGGPRYGVVYGDYPSGYVKRVALDTHYQEVRASNVAATKGRLVETGPTTVAGYAADEQIIDGEAGFYRFASVLVGTRGYGLSVRGTEVQVRSAEADRFVQSFAVDAP